MASSTSVTATMKDLYTLPGTRIKQWVVELRRNLAWEDETCPLVFVPEHDNDQGSRCDSSGHTTQWRRLSNHECQFCNDLQDATIGRLDVAEWRAVRDSRPKPTEDRDALSEEVAPDLALLDHPTLRTRS